MFDNDFIVVFGKDVYFSKVAVAAARVQRFNAVGRFAIEIYRKYRFIHSSGSSCNVPGEEDIRGQKEKTAPSIDRTVFSFSGDGGDQEPRVCGMVWDETRPWDKRNPLAKIFRLRGKFRGFDPIAPHKKRKNSPVY